MGLLRWVWLRHFVSIDSNGPRGVIVRALMGWWHGAYMVRHNNSQPSPSIDTYIMSGIENGTWFLHVVLSLCSVKLLRLPIIIKFEPSQWNVELSRLLCLNWSWNLFEPRQGSTGQLKLLCFNWSWNADAHLFWLDEMDNGVNDLMFSHFNKKK